MLMLGSIGWILNKTQNCHWRKSKIKVIALGSGGGSIKEDRDAGRYYTSKNLETTLNNCYSACPLVFLGGKKNNNVTISIFGVSQNIHKRRRYFPKFSPNISWGRRVCKIYGASSDYVLDNMLSAEPNQMWLFKSSMIYVSVGSHHDSKSLLT